MPFTDQLDDLPIKYRSWRPVAICSLLVTVFLSIAMLARTTDVFTRGRVRDVAGADADVVRELELAGVRFLDNDIACSALKRINAKVNWNSDRNRFEISAIVGRGVSIEELTPYLDRLKSLREISGHRSRDFDIAAFKTRFPHIQIVGQR